MNILKDYLQFICDNWELITTIAVLLFVVYTKAKKFLMLSKEEKIEMALTNVKTIMLSLVMEAEKAYGSKTGAIKRSEVINNVLEKYPVLKTVTNQKELEEHLNKLINEALEEMKEILKNKGDGKHED